MKTRLVVLGCAALALAVGCNKSDDGGPVGGDSDVRKPGATTKADEPGEVKPTKQWDAKFGTATITGSVKYTGKPPKRRPIDMGGKPECAACQTGTPLDESVIVSPDGAVQNVFIYVKKGLEEWIFPVPTEPAVMHQKGCTFHPHVIGARVGQPIVMRNDDTFSHNVRSTPGSSKNAAFNFMQTVKGKEDQVKFSARDVFVRIGCDLHGWMRSNIGVVDNPYFVITGEDGKFELKNLPKGEFTIEAVHEEFGKKTQAVKLSDKETKAIYFEFSKQ